MARWGNGALDPETLLIVHHPDVLRLWIARYDRTKGASPAESAQAARWKAELEAIKLRGLPAHLAAPAISVEKRADGNTTEIAGSTQRLPPGM